MKLGNRLFSTLVLSLCVLGLSALGWIALAQPTGQPAKAAPAAPKGSAATTAPAQPAPASGGSDAAPSVTTGSATTAPGSAPAAASVDASMVAAMAADVRKLTSYPSRVPGTPGNVEAAKYVESRFKEIGLANVRSDTYQVTAPVTKGQKSSITINGRPLDVFPVYPNHVVPSSTASKGLSGPLIYAAGGRPADFNGMKVEGAIVALDFNSSLNWVTAADLGARAIVFLEPDATTRGEAERKFSSQPVEIPRFYAPRATADAIRGAGAMAKTAPVTVTLQSQVTWESVPVRNIIGEIPGTLPSQDKNGKTVANAIVINSYYDSMAITPDRAPGAEAAGNLAALLQVARYFKAHPPRYKLVFVANGAHHIALAGVRNFIAQHFFEQPKEGAAADAPRDEKAILEKDTYRAFIGLDLTSRTSTVGLFAKSAFYNQMGVGSENILLNQFADYAKAINRYAGEEATRRGIKDEQFYVDAVTGREGRTWRSYLPSLVALDSEVATMSQKPGLSFVTANDARSFQDTPFDTADKLILPNLAQQVGTITLLLDKSMGVAPEDQGKKNPKTGIDLLPDSATFASSQNFGFATARAIYRDVTKGTSFLPDTPIPDDQLLKEKDRRGLMAVGWVLDRNKDYKTYSGVRGAFVERARFSKGTPAVAQFVFVGPRVGDPKGGGTPSNEVEAYTVNRAGRIIFAPDLGSERGRFNPTFNKATNTTLSYKDKATNELNVDASLICFECRGTALFDTVDQRYFRILTEMTVLDAQSDAAPVEYGYLRPAANPGSWPELDPAAIVFMKPQSRFKLIMAAGLLGKRLVILQTQPKTGDARGKIIFEGAGVLVPESEDTPTNVTRVAYRTASDLWTLDHQRIQLLKRFGITNQRVENLHGMAGCKEASPEGTFACPTESVASANGGSIKAAEEALANYQYDKFYLEARRAFGLESRAYPDVEATAQDVLKGIIFYLALLLPFSFFVERLLFGFPDVRKQIVGTGGCFLIIFIGIRYVHPAFELAMTPFIILLAFIILALTVVVTSFLSGKFEAEIKRLKQGVHFADVGRLSAISAALGLGIANMRRRPTRTALTCVTLILLTFTVLSFTSVTASISNFARPYGTGTPAYMGMLIRQPDWGGLQEASVNSMRNEFSQRFDAVALRAWYLARDQGEPLQLRVNNLQDPNKFFYAPALLGLMPEEKDIGSPIPKALMKGKWFDGTRDDVCLLPAAMLRTPEETAALKADAGAAAPAAGEANDEDADKGPPLGLTLANAIGSKVQVGGRELEVIGIFDDDALAKTRDLDDEAVTPVDYQSEETKRSSTATSLAGAKGEETQVQRYQHMDANALLILPYETVLSLGGTTRSVAAGFKDPKAGQEQLQELMNRAALGIFGATPDEDGTLVARLYSSVESTGYEGFAALVIPILIAALIIANTMLGSVFERTREIGIYSSVGLAPIHVAALFIAEALVYAVLGSISGYLVAQAVAKVLTITNWLPGITVNYSSGSAVIATLIVMFTVLASTIYPAWAASRMSQPDIERRWRMSEPAGDVWRFQFPFTVSGLQPVGVAQFLADFFETHTDTSVGKFYTDKVTFSPLPLRDAVTLLNAGADNAPAVANAHPHPAGEVGNGHPPGHTTGGVKVNTAAVAGSPDAPPDTKLDLANIAADENTEVYRLAMRVWLAPFDMGVSQDTDILLVPSAEPGLYELQLKLVRQSGEIAAWKRVNRGFMSDLRKQLLLWRTIKPEGQQEYVLRGRAHVAGHHLPSEIPGAAVGTMASAEA